MESRSADCRAVLASDGEIGYWWGSPVEVESALQRRLRDSIMTQADMLAAKRTLDMILARSAEVEASDQVRNGAIRLLRLHPLRAADALQLSAAQFLFNQIGGTIEFVSLDDRLRLAAYAEGATILP